mmetsp:Transcript_63179/g.163312  ORF Transcript_63179/g.163312 Transcript_63179/m.163312 type:complete len:260 (-) Transcript_63179:221-1000(-)
MHGHVSRQLASRQHERSQADACRAATLSGPPNSSMASQTCRPESTQPARSDANRARKSAKLSQLLCATSPSRKATFMSGGARKANASQLQCMTWSETSTVNPNGSSCSGPASMPNSSPSSRAAVWLRASPTLAKPPTSMSQRPGKVAFAWDRWWHSTRTSSPERSKMRTPTPRHRMPRRTTAPRGPMPATSDEVSCRNSASSPSSLPKPHSLGSFSTSSSRSSAWDGSTDAGPYSQATVGGALTITFSSWARPKRTPRS